MLGRGHTHAPRRDVSPPCPFFFAHQAKIEKEVFLQFQAIQIEHGQMKSELRYQVVQNVIMSCHNTIMMSKNEKRDPRVHEWAREE